MLTFFFKARDPQWKDKRPARDFKASGCRVLIYDLSLGVESSLSFCSNGGGGGGGGGTRKRRDSYYDRSYDRYDRYERCDEYDYRYRWVQTELQSLTVVPERVCHILGSISVAGARRRPTTVDTGPVLVPTARVSETRTMQ